MPTLQEAVNDFTSQEHIAVTGVSSTREDSANAIYKRLKSHGCKVYAINPKLETYDGDQCYPDLASVPAEVGGVMIVNRKEVTEEIVKQCAELGIQRVWMHRSMEMAGSSVSDEAVAFCKENGIMVIPGGCPMMFVEPVDFGHKCMRWMQKVSGGLPKQV